MLEYSALEISNMAFINAASISPAIELIFVNNTPVMREDSVYVEFESSPRLPGLLMQCHITRLDRDIRDYCETLCNVHAYSELYTCTI